MSEVNESEVRNILGTRDEYVAYLMKRDKRRLVVAPDTDALWIAQPRQLSDRAPVVYASSIVKEHYLQPFGRLPIPKFIEPCWFVRQRCYHCTFKYLYHIICWCEECKVWDLHYGASKAPSEIVLGNTIEAFYPHHGDAEHHYDDTDKRFYAYYNFGAAPEEIQKIYQRYNRVGKERCHVPPPEHLRRIPVIQDLFEKESK